MEVFDGPAPGLDGRGQVRSRMVKQLIQPSNHSRPGPSKQISKQVFPHHHFSKPLKTEGFSSPV